MPKSKRDKKVTLAKTKKKVGLAFKQALVDKIRGSVDKYPRCFVFAIENNRNVHLKSLRDEWKGKADFFMGKNRVMALALGKSEAEEYSDGLHKVSAVLRNQRGLLFADESQESVEAFFSQHESDDYLRTGGRAGETVRLESGPLEQFPHSMEAQLRTHLGLPTSLKKGVVHLERDFVVCSEGEVVTSEQARILKLLGHQQAKFKVKLIAVWNKDDGKFKKLSNSMEDELISVLNDNNEDEENMSE